MANSNSVTATEAAGLIQQTATELRTPLTAEQFAEARESLERYLNSRDVQRGDIVHVPITPRMEWSVNYDEIRVEPITYITVNTWPEPIETTRIVYEDLLSIEPLKKRVVKPKLAGFVLTKEGMKYNGK